MSEDDKPTPEELREAEALARGEGPPDALPMAALLRHAAETDALDPERKQSIREGLRFVRPRRRWIPVATALVAAAAVIVVLLTPRGGRATPLPPPTPALLAAQAEAARKSGGELLDREMLSYRAQVLATLQRRYR